MEETKLEICRQKSSGGVGIRNPVCTGRILALTFLCLKGICVCLVPQSVYSSKETAYHAPVHTVGAGLPHVAGLEKAKKNQGNWHCA